MLGPRIALLRRGMGWSQGDLARHLQVSPSAIGMYEQGRREPSAEMLVTLARVFDVTVDYLLTGVSTSDIQEKLHVTMDTVLAQADEQFANRSRRPFSRQELAVLFAALLMEG